MSMEKNEVLENAAQTGTKCHYHNRIVLLARKRKLVMGTCQSATQMNKLTLLTVYAKHKEKDEDR